MVRTLSVVLSAFALAACSNPTEVETDIISVTAQSSTLLIANRSDDPVYYFVADREALALIDWAVCVDPAKCEGIPPRTTKTIPYSEIVAYQPGSGSAIVYHWKITSKALGRYEPDSVRSLVVQLE